MGLTQIGVSILAAFPVGAMTRGAVRTYLLLFLSVLAIYWFQPALPFRSFDFWIPSISLFFVILTWFITSQAGAWKLRQNLIGLFIIVVTVVLVDLTRYIFPDPFLTTTTTPRLIIVLGFFVITAIVISVFTFLSRHIELTISLVILALIAILAVLK